MKYCVYTLYRYGSVMYVNGTVVCVSRSDCWIAVMNVVHKHL